MKKKVITAVILICVLTALSVPMVTRAVITPFFIAVDDTLLPFTGENMPYVTGGEYFIPHGVFNGVSVWSIASSEHVRVYTGASRYVDFYSTSGSVEDQDGNVLSWPAARRVGGRFYVPLRQICDFFGLSFDVLTVGRDIIPQEQMRVIRIRSPGHTALNSQTFFSLNRTALRNAYNQYYSPPESPTTPTEGVEPVSPPPSPEVPPKYNDVTIHHSFYGTSSDGTSALLELLDSSPLVDKPLCFFVNEDDIKENPGIIRKIYGSGFSVGIWLKEGTIEEYINTSRLLFEAAKIKTVLVLLDLEIDEESDADADAIAEAFADYGILAWDKSTGLAYDDTFSIEAVTDMLPKESGERRNLIAPCSEFTALMLVDIISFLLEFEYTIEGITEMTSLPLHVREASRHLVEDGE